MKDEQIGEVGHIDFYRNLRDRIHSWAKQKGKSYEYLEYLLLAPDFFYLLVKLMLHKRVPMKAKARTGIVLIYYLSPFDIIPEALLGPIGFADDLVLAVWTINYLVRSVDREVLVELWPSNVDLFAAMERILKVSEEWLTKKPYQKLKDFFTQKVLKG